MKKFIGFFANFSEGHTKKIEKAYRILKKVSTETRHDNRDTQILDRIVKKLDWMIEQQYEKVDKK